MPWYDSYEAFWPDLTEAQKQRLEVGRSLQERSLELLRKEETSHAPWTLEENRVPGGIKKWDGQMVFDQVITAYIDVAVQQADAQLARFPMPEDQEATIRFPGVSPRGKYSVIDMKFAQRAAGVEAAMQLCSGERRQMAERILNSTEYSRLWEQMQEAARDHRRYSRAAKLCRNEEARELLAQKAGKCKTDSGVVDMKRVMDGLEHLVGLRAAPPAAEDARWLQQRLRFPEVSRLGPVRGEEALPDCLEVRFENFEDRLQQQLFSAPQNWNTPAERLQQTHLQLREVYAGIKPYATASVLKVLAPAFANAQSNGLAATDLLLIDGETATERLARLYSDEAMTPAQVQEHTAAMVVAALHTGKRVEAFVPTADGRIPSIPARIVPSGYQPGPAVQEVVLTAWERFWGHLGFFKEKTELGKDYLREQALDNARQKVTDSFADRLFTPRVAQAQARQAGR